MITKIIYFTVLVGVEAGLSVAPRRPEELVDRLRDLVYIPMVEFDFSAPTVQKTCSSLTDGPFCDFLNDGIASRTRRSGGPTSMSEIVDGVYSEQVFAHHKDEENANRMMDLIGGVMNKKNKNLGELLNRRGDILELATDGTKLGLFEEEEEKLETAVTREFRFGELCFQNKPVEGFVFFPEVIDCYSEGLYNSHLYTIIGFETPVVVTEIKVRGMGYIVGRTPSKKKTGNQKTTLQWKAGVNTLSSSQKEATRLMQMLLVKGKLEGLEDNRGSDPLVSKFETASEYDLEQVYSHVLFSGSETPNSASISGSAGAVATETPAPGTGPGTTPETPASTGEGTTGGEADAPAATVAAETSSPGSTARPAESAAPAPSKHKYQRHYLFGNDYAARSRRHTFTACEKIRMQLWDFIAKYHPKIAEDLRYMSQNGGQLPMHLRNEIRDDNWKPVGKTGNSGSGNESGGAPCLLSNPANLRMGGEGEETIVADGEKVNSSTGVAADGENTLSRDAGASNREMAASSVRVKTNPNAAQQELRLERLRSIVDRGNSPATRASFLKQLHGLLSECDPENRGEFHYINKLSHVQKVDEIVLYGLVEVESIKFSEIPPKFSNGWDSSIEKKSVMQRIFVQRSLVASNELKFATGELDGMSNVVSLKTAYENRWKLREKRPMWHTKENQQQYCPGESEGDEDEELSNTDHQGELANPNQPIRMWPLLKSVLQSYAHEHREVSLPFDDVEKALKQGKKSNKFASWINANIVGNPEFDTLAGAVMVAKRLDLIEGLPRSADESTTVSSEVASSLDDTDGDEEDDSDVQVQKGGMDAIFGVVEGIFGGKPKAGSGTISEKKPSDFMGDILESFFGGFDKRNNEDDADSTGSSEDEDGKDHEGVHGNDDDDEEDSSEGEDDDHDDPFERWANDKDFDPILGKKEQDSMFQKSEELIEEKLEPAENPTSLEKQAEPTDEREKTPEEIRDEDEKFFQEARENLAEESTFAVNMRGSLEREIGRNAGAPDFDDMPGGTLHGIPGADGIPAQPDIGGMPGGGADMGGMPGHAGIPVDIPSGGAAGDANLGGIPGGVPGADPMFVPGVGTDQNDRVRELAKDIVGSAKEAEDIQKENESSQPADSSTTDSSATAPAEESLARSSAEAEGTESTAGTETDPGSDPAGDIAEPSEQAVNDAQNLIDQIAKIAAGGQGEEELADDHENSSSLERDSGSMQEGDSDRNENSDESDEDAGRYRNSKVTSTISKKGFSIKKAFVPNRKGFAVRKRGTSSPSSTNKKSETSKSNKPKGLPVSRFQVRKWLREINEKEKSADKTGGSENMFGIFQELLMGLTSSSKLESFDASATFEEDEVNEEGERNVEDMLRAAAPGINAFSVDSMLNVGDIVGQFR